MADQSKRQLPQHWAQGWAHCAFTPPPRIVFGQGETILIVERDRTLLKLGTALLENLNYRVLAAGNGEQMLELCRQEKIDVIVFDVEIDPHGDEDLLNQVLQILPGVKILLATAHDISLGLSSCPPTANRPTLHKPFTVQSFSQALRRCLENR